MAEISQRERLTQHMLDTYGTEAEYLCAKAQETEISIRGRLNC